MFYLPADMPFLALYILIWIITVLLAWILSFLWSSVVGAPAFAATLATVPLIDFFVTNLAYYIAIVGAVGAIMHRGLAAQTREHPVPGVVPVQCRITDIDAREGG